MKRIMKKYKKPLIIIGICILLTIIGISSDNQDEIAQKILIAIIHYLSNCGEKNSKPTTKADAIASGLTSCKKYAN